MIKIIDSSFDRENELVKFCENSPFGCKVLSVYLCYDTALDFVDIWYQTDENNRIIGAISSFENNFTLMLSDNSNLEEIRSFLVFKNPRFILAESKYYISDIEKSRVGDVMKYHGEICFDDKVIIPEVDKAYSLMKDNESDDFPVPEYNYFLSDVMHRKNLDKFSIFGIFDRELLSVAMTVAECEKSVVIGGVATDKNIRNKGLGKRTVTHISSKFLQEKKSVFVYCAKKNTKFYEKCGFSKIFEFTEYTKR
ncbi:MAG: GNAT family N-acetyltransferase [Oscillospiraceae bacterium]|nr:GNAT family N-acetyltransferase [Candidatus Ruminococcus equi]